MNIRSKLLFSFLVIILLFGLYGYFSYQQIKIISKPLNSAVPKNINEFNNFLSSTKLMHTIKYLNEIRSQSARNYAFTQNLKWKDNYKRTNKNQTNLLKQLNQRHQLHPNKNILKKLQNHNKNLTKIEAQSIDFTDQNLQKKALKMLDSKNYLLTKNTYQQDINDFFSLEQELLSNSYKNSCQKMTVAASQANEVLENSAKISLTYFFIAITIMIFTGLLISNIVSRPIIDLTKNILSMRAGNMKQRAKVTSHDEIGELAESFNLMAEKLQTTTVSKNELLQANENLLKAQQKAEIANISKRDFIANMTHELKTPLNSLYIIAQVLNTEDDALGIDLKDYYKIMKKSCEELMRLIDDLLDLAKVEAGKLNMQFNDISLDMLFAEIETNFQPLADNANIGFKLIKENNLPTNIITDEKRLHQILKNFLSNALKFTAKGFVSLRSFVPENSTGFKTLKLPPNEIIGFEVEDTGQGMSPENLELIFEKFHQLDGSITRHTGGTGLGLSISKDLAELLHGEITVKSEVNKGTTITIYIPQIYIDEIS